MDKLMEEDLKGLEEEIDDAVDRLFVEKKKGSAEGFLMESQLPEPSLKPQGLEPSMKPSTLEPLMKSPTFDSSLKSPALEPYPKSPELEPLIESSLSEPSYELDQLFNLESSPAPPSPPVPFLKSIENMEAQLLSLEWEITEEKLKKTKEEVLALRELLKQKAEIPPILTFMDKVLSHMIKNGENIRPSWIKFLLDSKDTIKLLMKKETGGEINIYKQLASQGIEARFSCLEGMKAPQPIPPVFPKEERVEKAEVSILREKKLEDLSNKMNGFMERAEEIFGTMKKQISRLEATARTTPVPFMDVKNLPVHITIFKVDEKLFGVESEKVFKLFKVPHTFLEKYSDLQKIRLRDLTVKMIDLKKMLSIQEKEPKGEIRILTVKDNGEYKGFLIDQVIKKLYTLSDKAGEVGEYFSGVIHSTYQEQSVEIPILDLKKF
jgi:chemotaxis signal transduction protein